MVAVAETRTSAPWARIAAWLPLVSLPVAAVWLAAEWPSWVFMWVLAFSIYAGLKWFSFAVSVDPSESTVGRSLGYLLLWPGMDAKSFFSTDQVVERPSLREWLLALAKLVLGVILIVVATFLVNRCPMIAGWVGMAGCVFTLHFGLFHLLSVVWRRAGVDAPPIMDTPLLASSLSDFWGRRWNLAFRDLSHAYVFRPLVGRLGIARTTMAVFLVSGIVHDAVISIPARGGFGLPTLYFAIQGFGFLFERSRLGKRVGTRKGITGRLFCATVTLGPIFLLFHQPFVGRVIVPMFVAFGSFWD
jgi:alginate O-acetyltransferase complex protein AlgI